MRQVARTWRLRQALISGHDHLRTTAQLAEQDLQTAIAGCPILTHLAQRLTEILDAACRASSLVENVNGLLKQFLLNRRAFRNPETLQHYLNLFTLWHNMRVYPAGQAPGQRAPISTLASSLVRRLARATRLSCCCLATALSDNNCCRFIV